MGTPTRRRRAMALLVPLICLALLHPGVAGAAAADNACANPTLDAGTAGWGALGGQATERRAITDHPVARWEFAVAGGAADTVGIYLPELAVQPDAVWDVGADVRTAGEPARMRMEMDWYSDSRGYLGHSDGDYRPVLGRPAFTRVSASFTVPAGAARAHVLLRATDLAAGTGFAATMCGYTPASAVPDPPPADDGEVQAAVRYGWGEPLAQYSDEFDYVGPPRAGTWGIAGQCWANPHAAGGRRCASRTTVDGAKLVMTGLADGDTGWLQSEWSTRYGRWEARVRSRNTAAANGRTYHPLLIVWPDGDRWPDEGEYDLLENQAPGAPCAQAFLHYPHPASVPIQQEFVTDPHCAAPLSEWHTIAFEWTPAHVRGFVDGQVWFTFAGGANARRRAMQSMASGHLTIQLDNFDGTDMTPASYELDWVRVYPVR